MIVGVMQPYLFPYLGYYQLVFHCDKFVFYDDVNYITRGYINRNNILSNGKASRFTLPVLKASQNSKINSLYFSNDVKKILSSIKHSYSKAPFFNDVFPIIEEVILSTNKNVASITSLSIISVFNYLEIEKDFVFSSKLSYFKSDSAAENLISICKEFESVSYCNSIGGQSLYSKENFLKEGIELSFIQMKPISYIQGKNEFVSHLSIIDVLMWNSKEEVINLLSKYKLV
jgi:hypothetical protein